MSTIPAYYQQDNRSLCHTYTKNSSEDQAGGDESDQTIRLPQEQVAEKVGKPVITEDTGLNTNPIDRLLSEKTIQEVRTKEPIKSVMFLVGDCSCRERRF